MKRQFMMLCVIAPALFSSITGVVSICPHSAVLSPYPCTNESVTSLECENLGCCWNDTKIHNITQCYNMSSMASSTATTTITVAPTTKQSTSPFANRDGYCSVYEGIICKEWLNQTLAEQEKPLRFIDYRLGLNKTEEIIARFMKAIQQADDDPNDCKRLLKIIMCQYTLPPCNMYGAPKNYCREDCDKIFETCDGSLRELLGAAKSITDYLGIEFVHIGIPNCTQHKYSVESRSVNETCVHFGLFDFKKQPTPKPGLSVGAIIGGVTGAVVLFIIIVTIILIWNRQRNSKQKCGFHGVTFTAVTMRDRLRAETMRALDETKILSLYNPDDMIQFPLDRVEYVKDLGEGNFGQVFQGRAFGLRPTDKPDTELMVAVKTLKEGCSKEMKVSFLHEVTLMAVLQHENIVGLIAVSTEEEPYGMIFEFMSQGDLNQYLRHLGPYSFDQTPEKPEKQSLTHEDLLHITLQVASGMEHLQNMRFVHRDLATRNCLVGDGLVVKIADFGMSRDVYASDYYKVEGQAVMPIRWMPPEALLFGKFTVESDVYSFGVLLWEIYAFALQPYYGYTNEEVVEFIKKGVHLGKPEDCPDHIYNIMKNCWIKDSSQRPNFEVIIPQLKQEDVPYDLISEQATTSSDKHPLYMNTVIPAEEGSKKTSRESSPAIRRHNLAAPKQSNIGYVNVDVEAANNTPMSVEPYPSGKQNPTFEEGEQEI